MDAPGEIKNRLSVDEVVGEYVQLKASGSNFKGLCPFHHEKTPSFMVSPDKGIYHCFGCSEGGDIFTFVEKVEGLTFREALEKLATKAGVELPERGGDNQTARDHKQRLLEALDTASQYYHIQLGRSQSAKDYLLEKRGLSSDTLRQFRLGWAPDDGTRLVQFLRKQGFKDQEIIDAGLGRGKGRLTDLFRGRVVVPFFDHRGKVIGFTGRVLGDGMPKYLNTPQTSLFDKSHFVFGLYQARDSIRTQDEVVVVEGNLDVLSSAQAGVGHVVALSGTAATLGQLKQLARLTPNVTLAFDADSAGVAACTRSIPIAAQAGVSLSVVALPEGSDPDDVIRQSPDRWREILSNKRYALDWLIEHWASEHDLSSAEGKREFTDRISPNLRSLRDAVEQDHYVQVVADMVGVAPTTMAKKLSEKPKKYSPRKSLAIEPTALPARDEVETVATALLSLAVTYDDTRGALEDVDKVLFDERGKQLLVYLQQEEMEITVGDIPKELLEIENYVKILLLRGEEEYGSWSLLDRQVEAFSLTHRLQELKTKRHKQRLSREIAAAEAAGDDDLRRELLKQFQELK